MDKVYRRAIVVFMNNTTQTEMFKGFAVEIGTQVECFKSNRKAVVVEIYEAHCSGRIPVRAVDLETGAEMMPFVDECRVTKPYVSPLGAYKAHEMSQEIAERWADYNRRGNGR